LHIPVGGSGIVRKIDERTPMNEQTWTVTGMTCGHCVNAVTQEVSAVEGVGSVHVDLEKGLLTVNGVNPLDEDVVASAVDEAGYVLVRS
jgi:copper chaperone